MKQNPRNSQPDLSAKLIELGSVLKQVRQEKSLSLDEIAEKIRVSVRILKAIEEGKIRDLPEPVYIKGFIKRYADALELNGAEFALDFPINYSMPVMTKPWFNLRLPQLHPLHLYLLYIMLVFMSVNGLTSIVTKNAQNNNSNQIENPGLVSDNKKPEKVIFVNGNNKKGKPVTIDVTVKAKSWLKVVADGKVQFEGELPQGKQLRWEANEQLTVVAGNAGGVLVALNQQKATRLGVPGQLQKVTFAKNN